MVVGSALVAPPEDKEARRLEARRHREQERLKKLGPGRLRTIGADIVGVKNQIEEKTRQEEAEREEQRQVDEESEAIRRYLIHIESEDALAKRKELITLRNDWQLQASERERTRQQDARERARQIDPDGCAPGAAQKFNGEDPLRLERMRMQATQLRQWTLQQMDEKREQNALDAEEEAKYARYLIEIERLQNLYHTATERERTQISVEIQRFNKLLLEEKQEKERRQRELDDASDVAEIQTTIQSNLISENPLQAQLPGVPLDRRVRVDHWKGFSQEQTKQYLVKNDLLLADKAKKLDEVKQQEEEEAKRQREIHRILVEEEHQTQRKKAIQELDIKQSLDKQAREAAEREQRNAQQSRGKIESTFFQAFGRSYR